MTSPDRTRLTGRRCGILLLPLLLAVGAAASDTSTGSRLPYTEASPPWLQAVGSLQVPGVKFLEGRRTHHRERCSATLIVSAPGRSADTIVTAWHCLEFYRDLSRPITFTLFQGEKREVVREAYRLADGGGMHADWAILRLFRPVAAGLAPALLVHPDEADPGRQIVMAGFSRDSGPGTDGGALTYDPACRIHRQTQTSSDTDCRALRGASGGAVVQLSARGEPLLAGVISRGDSADLSIYVPVGVFRSTLQGYLDGVPAGVGRPAAR
jgi:hypothetical protein